MRIVTMYYLCQSQIANKLIEITPDCCCFEVRVSGNDSGYVGFQPRVSTTDYFRQIHVTQAQPFRSIEDLDLKTPLSLWLNATTTADVRFTVIMYLRD